MDQKMAKKILRKYVNADGSLSNLSPYIDWEPGDTEITLDGLFTSEEVEAIGWWVRNSPGSASEEVE